MRGRKGQVFWVPSWSLSSRGPAIHVAWIDAFRLELRNPRQNVDPWGAARITSPHSTQAAAGGRRVTMRASTIPHRTRPPAVARQVARGVSAALASSWLFLACAEETDQGGAATEASAEGDISLGDTTSDGQSGESQRFGGKNDQGVCLGLQVAEGCGGEVFEGESVPLDLYLMFDQSGSMATEVDAETGAQRIDVVREAVRAFLEDEQSVGIGVGIGYFGHQPLRETSCEPGDYSEPEVGIGPLPGHESALLDSLEARQPTGETPTGAAIRGACDYVASYRADHPGRAPSILLVTDGEPKAPLSEDTCAPTLDDAVLAAEACFLESGIRTYVLGVGPSLTNLRVIAEAGGTKQAYLAELDNTDQVLNALRAVRGSALLPCEMTLSEQDVGSDGVEFGSSTLAYLDDECVYVSIPEVKGEAACEDGADGFYFDDPEAPGRIILCEATCGDVKSTGQQLFYSLGCPLSVVR